MVKLICFILLSGLLAEFSVKDIKTRTVDNVRSMVLFGICISYVVTGYFTGGKSFGIVTDGLLGFLFALTVMIIPCITGKGIGGADIKILSSLGLFWGLGKIPLLMVISFVMAALFGLIYKRFIRKEENITVPLVPFILIGHIAVFFLMF